MTVAADADTAWDVLSDYDHLAEFVPGMTSSRLVSAPGEALLLEQKGEARFLFFSQNIEVVLRVSEVAHREIEFDAVGGNMQRMRGAWRLNGPDGSVTVSYDAEIEPAFWMPPLIGAALLRRDLSGKMASVAREMVRRQTLRRRGEVVPP
jgi:carbon monoxide dehydrogenase subunit G